MATTAFSFDLNKEFDPNWEEDSAQRIFSGMADQEKKQVDQTVVETGVKSLQPERSYTPAKEGKGRLTSDMTGNPLDDFEAPLKKEAPKEAPVVESEQSDEPPSPGRIIADGYNYISQIKAVQSGRFGKTREVQREKALDNQAIFQAYSAMQARLSERGYDDPTLVNTLGTHKGGGFRSAEDIDRLFEIKAKGLEYRTQDGNIAKLGPNAPWSAIVDAADEAGGITIMKPSDPLKTAQESINLVKSFLDADGKPLPGKEAIVESLYNKVDTDLGVPTGVARYSDQLSRLEGQEARMNNAVVAGVGYGEISKENLPQEIARLKQQQVTLAVDNAPYFKDRETLKSWASDKNTRRLPFFTDVNGARVLARMTEDDPNNLSIWAPTQNDWISAAPPKKETPAQEKTATNSKPNETGKKLNKLTAPVADLTSRYTPQELFEKAGDRVIDAGLNIGDYLATGVRNNVLAPALEFSAGAAGKELDLEDLPNPSFKDRKWKNLTSKERAALLGRSSPGLTTMEAALKTK
jgi:hypothetical protein